MTFGYDWCDKWSLPIDNNDLTTIYIEIILIAIVDVMSSLYFPHTIDVHTQANYQQMDEGFIGLIFSVFNEDKSTKVSKHMLTIVIFTCSVQL